MNRPLVIAHRGASQQAPENTIAAFKKALEMHVDFIECDLQLTKDGIPVIFHDDTIERTTDSHKKKRIDELYFSELRDLSAGVWFSQQFAQEKIPTLKELLQLTQNMGLMLEIKNSTHDPKKVVDAILKEVAQHSSKKAKIFFATSDLILIHELLNKHSLENIMGIVTEQELTDKFLALGIKKLAVDYEFLNQNYLSRVPKSIEIWAWTVDDALIAHRLIELGVSGIITNQPDLRLL